MISLMASIKRRTTRNLVKITAEENGRAGCVMGSEDEDDDEETAYKTALGC